MDVRVDELRARLAPWVADRDAAPDGAEDAEGEVAARPSAVRVALSRVVSRQRPASWEFGIALVVLFIFGRLNVLFLRQRLSDLFGGPVSALRWQDDVAVQSVFAFASIAVLAVAVRRARPSALLRQPVLLGFALLTWLSIMWSAHPGVSLRRSLLFVLTIVVGWYIGDRFRTRDQLALVVGGSILAVVATVVALVFWTDRAMTTNGVSREWSGMYVNRNALAMVLSVGTLAIIFLIASSSRRPPLVAIGATFLVLLYLTGSRTGPVGLVGAAAVSASVAIFRRYAHISPARGAYITFATLGTIGLVVHWNWHDVLGLLGRSPTLTSRTYVWQVSRWFIDQHPWTGWGFEALWTDPRAVEQTYDALGKYTYNAHNGYYDLALSVGWVGVALFGLFLGVALWRAFRYAWSRRDAISLWPLTFLVYAVIVNFSETLFLASEAVMALTVACAVAVTEWPNRDTT